MSREHQDRWLYILVITGSLLAVGCSTFVLTSTPKAEVYEGDEWLGETPYRFKLVSGARWLTLKRWGYVEEKVLISALAPKKLHLEMTWVGRTRVRTKPFGAHVVDVETGEELGVTPCGLFLHRPEVVELRLEGFITEERKLTPNHTYEVELKPEAGFQSAFSRDILFQSAQGAVGIYDRVAGRMLGTTPARLNVQAGTSLQYVLAGYEPKSELISRKTPHFINIELEPIKEITVVGTEGAEIYRTGGSEKIGDVPCAVTVRGPMMFDVRKSGYYPETVSVTIDSPATLAIELKRVPYKTIDTEPSGADIYRLGGLEKLGDVPFTALVESERIFEIRKQGYKKRIIGVGPGSPETLLVPLLPIESSEQDSAAIVEIDGFTDTPY